MQQTEEEIKRVKSQKFSLPTYLLEDLPSNLPYIHNCCKKTKTTLHKPQRKLFNSLLYFLTQYGQEGDICIYAGSSTGENIAAVAELFPFIKFYLYDPKRTKTAHLDNIIVVTNNKGEGVKFTEDTIKEFIDKRDKVLLFSDIRNVDNKGNVTESIVDSDLMLQLFWVEKLMPRAFSLKFRLPYTEASKTKTSFREYIDGSGILQPFSPDFTTEVRLMNESKNIFDKNKRLKLKKWTLSTHENKMFYLNVILREWAYFTNVDEDVIGGDHCFDCSLESYFCKKFLDKQYSSIPDLSSLPGKTNVSKLRNWISRYHEKLNLAPPEPPKVSKEYQTLKFEKPPAYFHGKLPIQDRDIGAFLKTSDPITVFENLIDKRGRVNLPKKDLRSLLTKYKSLIEESITHKSMNSEKNYELLEFRGDRILGDTIAKYFFDIYRKSTLKEKSVRLLNDLYSSFTSGETAAGLFAEKAGIKDIIIVNEEECCFDSTAEDVFEAVLAVIGLIFDETYAVGIGFSICYNIVSSILEEVDFCDFRLKIFPPKTELKELFNENQSKGYLFDKQYVVTVGDGKFKDVHDSTQEKVRVEIINLPASLGLPKIPLPPVYEEYGPKTRVERNACLLFLEFYRNRDIVPRPKNRDLGFLNC
jgi:dsRNA-specific ribonuclease